MKVLTDEVLSCPDKGFPALPGWPCGQGYYFYFFRTHPRNWSSSRRCLRPALYRTLWKSCQVAFMKYGMVWRPIREQGICSAIPLSTTHCLGEERSAEWGIDWVWVGIASWPRKRRVRYRCGLSPLEALDPRELGLSGEWDPVNMK